MIEMAADWVIRPHTVDEFRSPLNTLDGSAPN